MKKLEQVGTMFFIIGLVAIFVSVNMQATVYSEYAGEGRNSYNIGMLNERSNYVLVSCFVTLIGAIWIGISQIGGVSNPKIDNKDNTITPND